LALAYRLYQDATRASELVALNDAPYRLFMPTSGKALAA
jgi:prophage DNA circulation protein